MSETSLVLKQLPQNPIFLVGYPRSGTTLLQALLATQECVYTLPETHFFNVVEKKIEIGEHGTILPSCLDNVFNTIYEKMGFRFNAEEIKIIRQCVSKKELMPKNLFEFIIFRFIGNDVDKLNSKYRWLEKTPNHLNFLDRIYELYPKVQFINIIRHPVAAILSRKQNFPFNKYTPTIELIEMWKRSIKNAEAFNKFHSDSIYSLKYEDLVENPIKELNSLCIYLKINFKEMLITNYKDLLKKFILPTEIWKNDIFKKQIINTNYNYVNNLNEEEISNIQDLLSAEMIRYDYKGLKDY